MNINNFIKKKYTSTDPATFKLLTIYFPNHTDFVPPFPTGSTAWAISVALCNVSSSMAGRGGGVRGV